MSQENNVATDEQQAVFNIQRVYLKDASVEIPHAPHIFLEQSAPTIEIALDVNAQRLGDVVYESEVTVTVTAKIADKVAFLIEAKQAGIFEIANVPVEQIDPLLGILCPNVIYPYLRVNIADLVTRTGFAPIHLADVNFENFYQQRLAALQERAQSEDGTSPSGIVLNS
jgi:preprotein translocase subunit SecB